MACAARPAVAIRLGRYVVVAATCALGSATASFRAGSLDCVAVSLVGIAMVGVLTPWLHGWYWLPMALVGYGWLQVCAHNHTGDYLPLALPLAIGSAGAGAAVYASLPRRP
jgi:hypothetical protein